jgi:CheY-like chemotaxis protein
VDHPRAAGIDLGGTRVLCIDNDNSILDGMQTLLGGWGCIVKTASGGKAACAVVEDFEPDIVLADYHLEDETGIDVVARLRDIVSSDLPAILITADRSPQVRDIAKTNAMTVLHKPVKPAALRAVFSQRRVRSTAAE